MLSPKAFLMSLAFAGCVTGCVQPRVERAYFVQHAEFMDKRFDYNQQVAVEMRSTRNGGLTFTYQFTDDTGKALSGQAASITLSAAEKMDFAVVCCQAWRITNPSALKGEWGWIAGLDKFRGERAECCCDALGNARFYLLFEGADRQPPIYLRLPAAGVHATLSLLTTTELGKRLSIKREVVLASLLKEPPVFPRQHHQELATIGSLLRKMGAESWYDLEDRLRARRFETSSLDANERDYLLASFPRLTPTNGTRSSITGDAGTLLRLKLNDPEMTADLRASFQAGGFQARKAARCCVHLGNPELLPIVAEFLSAPDDGRSVFAECTSTWVSPGPHATAAFISLIAESHEFPEPVRNSAIQLMPKPVNWICRAWWDKNREAVLKGDYAKVTPLSTRWESYLP